MTALLQRRSPVEPSHCRQSASFRRLNDLPARGYEVHDQCVGATHHGDGGAGDAIVVLAWLDPIEPVGQVSQVGDVDCDGACAAAVAAVGDVACGGLCGRHRCRFGLAPRSSLSQSTVWGSGSVVAAPRQRQRKDEN